MTKGEIKEKIELLDWTIESLTGFKSVKGSETKKMEWRREELVAKRDALVEKLYKDEV